MINPADCITNRSQMGHSLARSEATCIADGQSDVLIDAVRGLAELTGLKPVCTIQSNDQVFRAFGITLAAAQDNTFSSLLLMRGCDVPLICLPAT